MEAILLTIHVLTTLALIGIVLLQKSEGGGLGIGGGSGGMGAFAGVQQTANILTRTTAILATIFICTNLSLALIAKNKAEPTRILEKLERAADPATTVPSAEPEIPATPQAPEAQ